jgi:hypothetical protein
VEWQDVGLRDQVTSAGPGSGYQCKRRLLRETIERSGDHKWKKHAKEGGAEDFSLEKLL